MTTCDDTAVGPVDCSLFPLGLSDHLLMAAAFSIYLVYTSPHPPITRVALFSPTYRITRGDKITHPLGRISAPVSSKTWGTRTTKMMAMERFRREESCVDASLVVFSTPSPLSRNLALKIVQGGVLYYHPSVIRHRTICIYGTVFVVYISILFRNVTTLTLYGPPPPASIGTTNAYVRRCLPERHPPPASYPLPNMLCLSVTGRNLVALLNIRVQPQPGSLSLALLEYVSPNQTCLRYVLRFYPAPQTLYFLQYVESHIFFSAVDFC